MVRLYLFKDNHYNKYAIARGAFEPGQDRKVAALRICHGAVVLLIMEISQALINKLLNLASSTTREVPVAAFVLDDQGAVVSEATNECEKNDNPLRHAEMIALERALAKQPHSLKGHRILITLEPCLMCYGAIVHSGIDQIIYLAKNPDSGALSYFHVDTQKDNVTVRFLDDQRSQALIKSFFSKCRQ